MFVKYAMISFSICLFTLNVRASDSTMERFEIDKDGTKYVFSRSKADALKVKYSPLLTAPKPKYVQMNSQPCQDSELLYCFEMEAAKTTADAKQPVVCTDHAFDCVILGIIESQAPIIAHTKRKINFESLKPLLEGFSTQAQCLLSSRYCSDLGLEVYGFLTSHNFNNITCDFPEIYVDCEIDNTTHEINKLASLTITVDPIIYPTKESLPYPRGRSVAIDARTGSYYEGISSAKDVFDCRQPLDHKSSKLYLDQKVDESVLFQMLMRSNPNFLAQLFNQKQ